MIKSSVAVSVVIPAFNAEKTIKKVITSVLKEEKLTVEVIVVNDGSTDDTKNVVLGINDARIVYLEQPNQGVYAARNLALQAHTGKWLIFLDADDELSDGFIGQRVHVAEKEAADVVIFNADRYNSASHYRSPVHQKQRYNKIISGHEWLNDCVAKKEWPHYLWLQIVSSKYVRDNNITFRKGRSHKDILWTMNLAEANGRFFVSDTKDYTYIYNPDSITNRNDYYDLRAIDYIDIISIIIHSAYQLKNSDVRKSLLQHALFESRHFLGLYRKKVHKKEDIKRLFNASIALKELFKGIRNFSDLAFFAKLLIKMN